MRYLALAALLAASNAYADATAVATVTNRTPTVLTRADGSSSIIDGNTALVRLGDTLSYSFDYHLAVSDSGLQVSDGTRAAFSGPFWNSSAITLGAEGAHGFVLVNSFEVAMASIYVFPSSRPWENLSGPALVLATHSDDVAEQQSLDGHGSVSFSILAGQGVQEQVFTLPELQVDSVAMADPRAQPQQVSAVPEPQTWALLVAGLAWLSLRRRAS